MVSHKAGVPLDEPTKTPTKPSYLLAIPPELRLEIYSFVLGNHGSHFEFSITQNGGVSNPEPPALLRVCKLIREESISPFNKRLTAMLEESRRLMAAATADVTSHEKIWKQNHISRNWSKFLLASDRETECEQDLRNVRRYVEQERALLRQEGFQV